MKLFLNRYQIQIYSNKSSTIRIGEQEMILCEIFEGFTFEDACKRAEKFLKEKMDTSKNNIPIRIFYPK